MGKGMWKTFSGRLNTPSQAGGTISCLPFLRSGEREKKAGRGIEKQTKTGENAEQE